MLSFKRQEKAEGSIQTANTKHPSYLVGPATVGSIKYEFNRVNLIPHDFVCISVTYITSRTILFHVHKLAGKIP